MSLFQISVLKKYLKQQDNEAVTKAYKKFAKYFHNPGTQQIIRSCKEEEYQSIFLSELFSKILGYTIKGDSNPNFNLVMEHKNEKNSKKADGAILKDGKALAVIELKGTNTKKLEKVSGQAFGYKANQTGCIYVITSNFEKIRFYINDAVECEEFNLFNLKPERFQLLYLCLVKNNLLNNLPLKIKEESVQEEEKITKLFYAHYSLFKRELYRDLVKQNMKNEVFRSELNRADTDRGTKNIKRSLFKKSQKLIDRFLFIFFAEDCGLVSPNFNLKIIREWDKLKELDEAVPLYKRYKKHFNYLDQGRKGTDKTTEIFAYNGGLFKPDAVLDSLLISDELLHKHTKELSHYDFESQVDVNILGHIFENSLNEIESINAEIEETDFDKQKTKRKKDGVFYTPKYITKYIVDNTIGKLCAEKKIELKIDKIDLGKSYFIKAKRTIKQEIEVTTGKGKVRTEKILKTNISVEGEKIIESIEEYRNWLLQITICDPACGSGAFLNQALNFLITEHTLITEQIQYIKGDASAMFIDIEKTILENNIFGVDINEESVEIAKLSLWLRTAQPRRKLNVLSNNIKCGNSLIESKAGAGNKAFKWEEEFAYVFEKGGFDVVVGNPPYVHLEAIKAESEQLAKLKYSTFDKRGDLYPLFVEKGVNILKEDGLISYIMPNKWLQAGYGGKLREYFLIYQLNQLIDFGDIQIFQGATTYPCIFVARKALPKSDFSVSVLKSTNSFDFDSMVSNTAETFEISEFSGDTWVISSQKEKRLLTRISSQQKTLSEFIDNKFYYGLKTGLSEAFLIDEATKNKLIDSDARASNFIHPFLQGRDVQPYVSPEAYNYLLLFEKGFTKSQIGDCTEEEAWMWLEKTYPSIAEWLFQFEERGRKRTDKGDFWWEVRACDYYSEFHKPKIMYQAFQVKPCFVYDTNSLYCNNSMWIIPTDNKALVGVLNSKMGWWLITKFCTQIQNGCQLIWKYFGQVPIPELTNPGLLSSTENMIVLKEKLQSKSDMFSTFVKSQFSIEKLTNKLQSWHELNFSDFIKELNKVIKKAAGEKLSKLDEMEWMDGFESKKAEAQTLKTQIIQTDREIDQMVYELYGLNEEEIAIVEGQ